MDRKGEHDVWNRAWKIRSHQWEKVPRHMRKKETTKTKNANQTPNGNKFQCNETEKEMSEINGKYWARERWWGEYGKVVAPDSVSHH